MGEQPKITLFELKCNAPYLAIQTVVHCSSPYSSNCGTLSSPYNSNCREEKFSRKLFPIGVILMQTFTLTATGRMLCSEVAFRRE